MHIFSEGLLYLIVTLTLLVTAMFVIIMRRRAARKRSKLAFKRIESGICQQLYAFCTESKWRWVYYPSDFVKNGGIARITVCYSDGPLTVDVYLAQNGCMTLYVADTRELSRLEPAIHHVEPSDIGHVDSETISNWYNIVFIGALQRLISTLHENDEMSLFIDECGYVYTDRSGISIEIGKFAHMPHISLWSYITERLAVENNLYAEVQGNHLVVSWQENNYPASTTTEEPISFI